MADKKILAVFFTKGVSLEMWVAKGLFSREKLLYEAYVDSEYFDRVIWVTYGSRDRQIAQGLHADGQLSQDITVLPIPRLLDHYLGHWIFSLVAPLYYFSDLCRVAVVKSNQMKGAWTAWIAKKIYRKPFLLRTGYTLSRLEETMHPTRRLKHAGIRFLEAFLLKRCDAMIVSSQHDADYFKLTYSFEPTVAHTFIDVAAFKSLSLFRDSRRILYVGRLSPEKNVASLIQACAVVGCALDIYGQGELEEELRCLATQLGVDVVFKGSVPNAQLPGIYNQYTYYALTSFYEGMPKTLLEAMACGCVCIGTNVSGINEVIEDQKNGYLIDGLDAQSIATVLQAVFSADSTEVVQQAVSTIASDYSLSHYLQQEVEITQAILQKKTPV